MLRRVERLEDRLNPVILPADVAIEQIFDYDGIMTASAIAPDGRIFLSEKRLGIRIVKDGEMLAQPFVSLPVWDFIEQGVMGVALDPDFRNNGYVYVYHTRLQPGGGEVNRLSRFTAAGDTAIQGSEKILLEIDHPSTPNHIGGALHFGPDGKLYLAVGDHSEPAKAQSLNTLVGKILRINADGSIPQDNPFYERTTGINRSIWAFGLRNPFTFDISQRTGQMFINDVGNGAYEEVNQGVAGGNFGWPQQEGLNGLAPGLIAPIYTYAHGTGPDQGNAIAGAAIYEPETPSLPARYLGHYFFGDITGRYVKSIHPTTKEVTTFASDLPDSPLDLDVDAAGNLLMLATETGPVSGGDGIPSTRLYRFRLVGPSAPTILQEPEDAFVSTVQNATFRIALGQSEGVTYQWQRDGIDIPGANAAEYIIAKPSLRDDGATFRVIATNAFGAAVSRTVSLRVTDRLPPEVTLASPKDGLQFVAGDQISFRGFGRDLIDGTLGEQSLSWRIEYHTGNVSRPFAEGITGSSGSIALPTSTPYKGVNVFYRLILIGENSLGLTATASVDLLPITSRFTLFSTIPNALQLDGTPVSSGTVIEGVSGVERELLARREVIVDGMRYQFVRWSDGGERNHVIRTPILDQSFTAEYRLIGPAPKPGLGIGAGAFAELRRSDGSTLRVTPFGPNFSGGIRSTAAEVTGDGITDLIVGAGPGGAPIIVIYDGATEQEVHRFMAFEDSFRGGVYVAAADLNDDGIAEVVVTPDLGGGPLVAIFEGGTWKLLDRFYGIDDPNFRGGARIGVSDIDGDGYAELLVAAGVGGGPRVAIFDGEGLLKPRESSDVPLKLLPDFFVFESSLRNGVYISGGDIDGDTLGDVVVGGGPGGGPRVRILGGNPLLTGMAPDQATIGNFFAGDANNRAGVSVHVQDATDDGRDDVVTGLGTVVSVFTGLDVQSENPLLTTTFEPFEGLETDVFVG